MGSCPLPPGGDFVETPEFCLENCETKWERAMNDTSPVDFQDTEPPDHGVSCTDGVVAYGGEKIRSSGGSIRYVAVFNVCDGCKVDVYTETYMINCGK